MRCKCSPKLILAFTLYYSSIRQYCLIALSFHYYRTDNIIYRFCVVISPRFMTIMTSDLVIYDPLNLILFMSGEHQILTLLKRAGGGGQSTVHTFFYGFVWKQAFARRGGGLKSLKKAYALTKNI